jgi:type IV pilus assembly protein PilB
MRNERIGDYLVSQGLINDDQLQQVLAAQKESNGTKKFGDVVVELGFMSEVNFTKALAGKLRVQYVDLDNTEINTEAVQKVPEALARKHTVIAINVQGKRLTVATNDPVNFIVLEDIKVSTGMDTVPVLATTSAINKAIGKCYSMQNVDSVLEGVSAMGGDLGDMNAEDAEAKDRVENAPIVKLATTIVENSYRADATDIHIEPFDKYTRIRIRVNGDLVELMNISSAVHSALTTRLKLISGMNIAEKRIPQDGRFTQVVDGTTLDVRVSSLPMVSGEKIVIRILSTGQIALRKITDLGMSDYNYQLFESMLRVPQGVILVTGPTGSGKTTTLYTLLSEKNTPETNIVTVEDPVEIQIPGLNQVQVNAKAGMTFASGLRSILRQDPDIILVGEIRDGETAEIAMRAAITGHLVFSTIHTNDAVSSINRLIDMGIEPFMVSTALIGVVAQRLVRRICTNCREEYTPGPDEVELLHLKPGQKLYRGAGCSECNEKGYKGRIAIHEVVIMTKAMRALLERRASEDEMRQLAISEGTLMLADSAAQLVLEGITTVQEMSKVTYSIDG